MFDAITIACMVGAFAIYILTSLVLNRAHKKVFGYGTAMAFIPILDLFVLGKVAFNKWAGWILIIACLLNGTYTVTINGRETVYKLFNQEISGLYNLIFSLVIIALFIYMVVKISKFKKIENIGLGSYVKQSSIYQNENVVGTRGPISDSINDNEARKEDIPPFAPQFSANTSIEHPNQGFPSLDKDDSKALSNTENMEVENGSDIKQF